MTDDELIEAVARAIADVTDFDGDRMASRYADSELRDVARAAISVIAPAVLDHAYAAVIGYVHPDFPRQPGAAFASTQVRALKQKRIVNAN